MVVLVVEINLYRFLLSKQTRNDNNCNANEIFHLNVMGISGVNALN